MKKTIGLFFTIIASLALAGCGDIVEVPPAHVGKLTTDSGLQKGLIQPSKFRLEGLCITCDSLILAEASDYGIKEQMQVYMPQDQLNLQVDVRGVFSISADENNIQKVFARITPDQQVDKRVSKISMAKVYQTYASQVVRETVRSVMTKYTIAQVMENREAVSTEMAKEVRAQLVGLPVTAIRLGLADVQPPDVIVKAREAAKEREIAIQRAEADKQVALKEAEAALEVAIKQQQVDLKEAETQVLVNKKLAEGVNTAFVTQRWLKVMERLAENPDAKVMILPYEAISNPSLMMGVNGESLRELRRK